MANNISKITLPDKTTYNLKDSTAIHTGDAIVTGVKGSNETNYRTGQVNLTKDNVGLGNVGNFKAVSTVASQGLTDTEKSNARTNIGAGTSSFDGVYSSLSSKPTLGTAAAKDVASSGNASSTQVVMGNDTRLTNSRPASDVYSWAKASSKPTYTASEVGAIASSLKGATNGVAQLDANGLVPTSQLPSYVDDVLEYTAKADFPSTGETGKIYVDKTTNLTYRWSGTAYIEISPSLALGTTSSTAFRGDYGNVAYTHAVTNKGSAFSSGLYKITTNSEGHVTAATAVAKSDITGLGIPSQDTTYSDATTSTHGLMSTSDKTKLNGIASGAEVNQNAFSNIKVGSTTIAADGKTDTLEIAGSNVTITPDGTNDKITIGITKTNVTSALGYTPPTTNTTYENATTNAAGLMSADDKNKLDGIAAGAQVNTVTSVAGKTGAVTLAKGDVGLGNVDNTADSAKSVAYATNAGKVNNHTVNADVPSGAKFTDTTYSSKSAVSGGTDVSLVTTGEKYSWNNKLDKTTYEYNKEISFGSDGLLLIGKFPCYDSNITVEINATTKETYHAIAILATRNINTSGGGTFVWKTYGDSANTITPKLFAKYTSGSNVVEIYFSPSGGWSKNLIHIGCSGLAGSPTNICESVSSIPDTATRKPENTLLSMTVSNATTANGHTVNADVPSGAKFTDTTYSNATTSAAGLMSSSDKSKLDGIAAGAQVNAVTSVAGKTGAVTLAKSDVGLGNVENKSSATIRGELTKANVTTALGYTPPTTNTTYSVATTSADGLMSSTDKSKLNGIEEGAQVNSVTSVAGKTGAVTLSNSDVGLGNVGNFKAVSTVASQGLTDTEKSNARANIGAGTSSFNGAYSSLSGKPTLGTAAAKDVPSSGNASSTQVVLGNDSRLTNSRPASDVSSWAKASSKPTYTASEVGAIASTLKGAANGVAELDANGLVPTSQLPNYAMSTSVPASSTVSSTGLITFKNSAGTALFTLQLPLYNGSAV